MDSFKTRSSFVVNGETFHFNNLNSLNAQYDVDRLPYSIKVLLENLLRLEDGVSVTADDIEAILKWSSKEASEKEIAFTPARVILQDFTGVPAIVDLAAMRDAMRQLGGTPAHINPLSPVELVIDHSVMVDHFGTGQSFQENADLEFARNQERYGFLRWGQTAFDNFRVVPPDTGIVHQVNLEHLAQVVFSVDSHGQKIAYPDTVVGTDSHTTMINGLGVLGWGVGGIEAEAAMLGQAVTMLIPEVVGFKLTGVLKEGTTATDLVLTIVQMLRKKGVVGKFVEFYGQGLDQLPLADRATIANMAPEYGATCGIFPIDEETLRFLKLSGRPESQINLVEAYAKAQNMFRNSSAREAQYNDTLSLDLSTVEPCIAGPKRPQDRIALKDAKASFEIILNAQATPLAKALMNIKGQDHHLTHGAVVIAAITSCTNTSNPDVMLAAGLLAEKAHARGLKVQPWVKTSLAPGSQVVTDYLEKANLMQSLNALGFHLVGYGCTTCIGNSGPLPEFINEAIKTENLSVSAVLSGNRNFEGRIHPMVQNAYLASPPLVVAYALAGTVNIDWQKEAIGKDPAGVPVFLKDIWPTRAEIQATLAKSIDAKMFQKRYAEVFKGDARWQSLKVTASELYGWDDKSSYIQQPPYFQGMTATPKPIQDIVKARVLALLGDSVTTDHISPAGDIGINTSAGQYLISLGIAKEEFNSYGARRGNHEVMMRGTFANIRLKNLLVPGVEGGVTRHMPSQKILSIYDAAMRYQNESCPLIILAGKEYGTGSSRDWAAKGTMLLGVRAVIAESFERIHRSNLVGMGVLPLEFIKGQNAQTLGLDGNETFQIGLSHLTARKRLTVTASCTNGMVITFEVTVRIDTPKELEYYQHQGILHYVIRNLAKKAKVA